MIWEGGVYMRENGTICPFGVFPLLSHFSLNNWPYSLYNIVFWESQEAIFRPEKDK